MAQPIQGYDSQSEPNIVALDIKEYEDKHQTSVIALMRALREYLVRFNPDRLPQIPDKYFEKYLKKEPNRKILVAEVSGQIVGYVEGVVRWPDELDKLQFKNEHHGEIIDLYVDKAYRKHGIGKHLVDAISTYFTDEKCTKISLIVLKSNTEAVKFYLDHGFEEETLELSRKI